jgi:L-asparaginase II
MRLSIEVLVRRGSIDESRHLLEAAVVRPDGSIVAATDHLHRITTFRSAAKPFQLLSLVERGHADAYGFIDEELAVMASSHTGSARHVELVSGILARAGVSVADLACGWHEPLDPGSRELLAREPSKRSALYNNCSGKHAGMLALARAEGWPTAGYERLDHPLQQLLKRTTAEMCGLASETVPIGIDGCSVPVIGAPLDAMARAYARLACASASGGARDAALVRIREAMRAFPIAAGGEQRFSTALIQASGGRVVSKGGAEGLECFALVEAGIGGAVKCEDGNDRAVAPAVIALLERLGELSNDALARLAPWRRPVIRNHAGIEAGALEARVRVAAPATP